MFVTVVQRSRPRELASPTPLVHRHKDCNISSLLTTGQSKSSPHYDKYAWRLHLHPTETNLVNQKSSYRPRPSNPVGAWSSPHLKDLEPGSERSGTAWGG